MGLGERILLQWQLFFPLAYSVLSFLLAMKLAPELGSDFWAYTKRTLISLLIGTVAYLPVLIWIDIKTTILRRIWKEFVEKVKNFFKILYSSLKRSKK